LTVTGWGAPAAAWTRTASPSSLVASTWPGGSP